MATYFLNCSENIENYNLCINNNVAGFSFSGYQTGDLVYIIVKENNKWTLGGRGLLKDKSELKPWKDHENYISVFSIDWQSIERVDVTEGFRKIYKNFGLAIQGKKDIDSFERKGDELKSFFDSFFIDSQISSIPKHSITQQKNHFDMNLLTAIKTKPFILLAGISGSGKSRLVRSLAYKSCIKEELRNDLRKPGNFELIPVKPNWHDSSELMGYVSRISGEKYITTPFLKFLAKAWKYPEVPFFLCLDEMNLAPVEHYFAEYLSIIETRQVKDDKILTDYLISRVNFDNKELYAQLLKDLELDNNSLFVEGISIPNNFVVVGTVNMDETTHSFSRKVLDRAMTFEMNTIDLKSGLDINNEDWSYPCNADDFYQIDDIIGAYTSGAEVYSLNFEKKDEVLSYLENINNELEGTPFKIAYRVRDEFLIYCYYASLSTSDNWLINALDEMTIMKILSRIEGDESKLSNILENLLQIIGSNYKKSNAKIKEMQNRLNSIGYTSFWS